MGTLKKISAVLMAAALLASSVMITGCGKKKGNEEKIQEDEVWYSFKKAQVGTQFLADKYVSSSFMRFIGTADGKAVFMADIQRIVPDTKSASYFDNVEQLTYFEIYGKDGNLEKTIDVKKKIEDSDMFKLDPDDYPKLIERLRKNEKKDESGSEKTDKQIFTENNIKVNWHCTENYSVKGSFISISVQAFYPYEELGKADTRMVEVVFDANSGEITHYTEQKENSVTNSEIRFEFDGYEIVYTNKNEVGTGARTLTITSENGDFVKMKSQDLFTGDDDAMISSMIYLGDAKALMAIENGGFGKQKYYELDLKTGNSKESVTDYSWIEGDLYNATYVDGTGYVICNEEGLKKIDFRNKKKTEVFSFDACNINRSEALNMKLLAMTEDCIYLSAWTTFPLSRINSPADNGQTMYVLTKESKNPNAGKTVLHATVLSFFDYTLCEAVSVFNETNPDYFIKLDNNYTPLQKVNNGELSFYDDDFSEKYDKLASELIYQLCIDLMNGDGPDIVLDGAKVTNLNDSRYLLDLKKEIKTDGLFENIIRAGETDGKLYQCPLSVTITGFIAAKKDVASDQYGFTFDQYKDFVKGPCNGTDYISVYADQTDYFRRCLLAMNDSYYKNGKCDFDTPEFRALAEFVKDNVPVKRTGESNTYSLMPVEKNKRGVRYESGMTFPYLVNYYPDSISDMRMLGLPSNDGRGPLLYDSASVGISATTNEKKACVEFVKILLSEDIQQSFGLYTDCIPVRKTAYESTAEQAVEKYNSVYRQYKDMYPRESLIDMGYPFCEIDKKTIADFETMLNTCSVMAGEDTAISIIVCEEIPAYFTGQKSLDDVIKIINDRTQTYINERGRK